jgi:peptidoglycan/xylan/chitin deacetylase (PgdA/CDA1 family)
MPDHNRFPFRSTFDREPIEWPNGAKLAFYVGINIEFYHFEKRHGAGGRAPGIIDHVMWEYGARVGLFRIMDIMDKYKIRASILLNSDVCLYQPEIIKEGNKRQWEWLGHGVTNQQNMNSYPDENAERDAIIQVRDTIIRETGQTPKGWLGPGLGESFQTPDLLAEAGFEYVSDWSSDDQPVPMSVRGGRMIAMPYHSGVNDARLVARFNFTGPQYEEAVKAQFDCLYKYATGGGGLVMALPIHAHNVGQPYRLEGFERSIDYILSHDKVWNTTSGDIASWYYKNYYKSAPAPVAVRAG